MSAAGPPTIAVILPPREGFGPRRAGGIGLTVRQHALATTGHRTAVFGDRQSGPVFLDVTFRLIKAPFFAPVFGLARYTLGLLYPLRRLRPVIIEVHAEPRIALWLQRAFPTVPVVLVMHDVPATHRMTRTPERRARLFNRLARVITVSEWLRDRYLDGVAPPERMPVAVPPGVDLNALPPSVNGLDAAGVAMAQRRSRVMLFVGRLIADKGPDQFIAACTAALPSLPGWRAEVIGAAEHTVKSPETNFVRMVRATAEPAGIGMMGYRDHPDVMAAMARAAIVVAPNRAPEPAGRVVLEAMANGAAVICSSAGAMTEIGGDVAIAIDPTRPDEIAAAIVALGDDPRRLASLGEAGRKRAEQFDLPKIGRLVDRLRARIIAEGPPRL